METSSDNDVESKGIDFSSSRHSRRNKRKMTEPRRRATTDFSIRSICSSSNSDVDVDDDDDDEKDTKKTMLLDNRWRTDPAVTSSALGNRAGVYEAAPSRSDSSSPYKSNVTAAVLDSAASTFEHPKPYLFYPLNIPMVYSASLGIPPHHFNPFMTSSGLAVASGVTDGFAVPTLADSRRSLNSDVRRRSSPVENDNIPSPTKDEDQRLILRHGHVVESYDDSSDGRRIPPVFVDSSSKRKKQRGVSGDRRRSTSTSAKTASSAALSDAGSDGSPGRRPVAAGNVQRSGVGAQKSRRGASTGERSIKFATDEVSVLDEEELQSRTSSPLRKNYKNMTKQRRIEANARERTRVHTISAAFESLRRAVPSYSYNQRLSKLAILRIACSYILALARLTDLDSDVLGSTPRDDGSDSSDSMSFAECVDLCTRTIQTEGKAKRRH